MRSVTGLKNTFSKRSNSIRKPDADVKKIRRGFSAFTLAELIVVVAILAILATVGFVALSGYVKDAADARSKTNVRSVYAAI